MVHNQNVQLAVKVFGLDIASVDSGYLEPNGKLILSNHMSYLDIIVYASIRPSVFVSSVEIEKTPFLGFIAKLGGTFFLWNAETQSLLNLK